MSPQGRSEKRFGTRERVVLLVENSAIERRTNITHCASFGLASVLRDIIRNDIAAVLWTRWRSTMIKRSLADVERWLCRTILPLTDSLRTISTDNNDSNECVNAIPSLYRFTNTYNYFDRTAQYDYAHQIFYNYTIYRKKTAHSKKNSKPLKDFTEYISPWFLR